MAVGAAAVGAAAVGASMPAGGCVSDPSHGFGGLAWLLEPANDDDVFV